MISLLCLPPFLWIISSLLHFSPCISSGYLLPVFSTTVTSSPGVRVVLQPLVRLLPPVDMLLQLLIIVIIVLVHGSPLSHRAGGGRLWRGLVGIQGRGDKGEDSAILPQGGEEGRCRGLWVMSLPREGPACWAPLCCVEEQRGREGWRERGREGEGVGGGSVRGVEAHVLSLMLCLSLSVLLHCWYLVREIYVRAFLCFSLYTSEHV